MKEVGKSIYGSSFFQLEILGVKKNNRNIRSRSISLNWSIERVILQHQLVNLSIHNIISAIKVINKIDPKSCKFLFPQNDNDFEKPWLYSPGITSCNIDTIIPDDAVQPASKETLIEIIEKSKLRQQQETY